MKRITIFIWRGFAGLSCLLASCCYAKTSSINTNALADFEWFNRLGFPDVKGCPCVRLENGGSWTVKGEPVSIDHITAFVLATNAGNLRLFTADLSNLRKMKPMPKLARRT